MKRDTRARVPAKGPYKMPLRRPSRASERLRSRAYRKHARAQLRRFRRASSLAVALTGALLMFGSVSTGQGPAQETNPSEVRASAPTDTSTAERVGQATRPLRDLAQNVYRRLPNLAVAVLILLIAGVLAHAGRFIVRRIFVGWERAEAASAIVVVGIWILAIGAALSVLAGDVRALIGSVGLFGLALSWSLQTPIESFTGWLLNSFRGYYRVGDRISVGDVFGDVYAIDVLTTTVWEAGAQGKSVAAAQPTGALITFPNSEVLRTNIVNYTRDFPYIWDELTIGVANESDIPYAMRVFQDAAARVIGEDMAAPASAYQYLLREKQLDYDVAFAPQVYVKPQDAWTDLTVRYLIPARERRGWATKLFLALNEVAAAPEHRTRILPAYPRQQIELLDRSERDTNS